MVFTIVCNQQKTERCIEIFLNNILREKIIDFLEFFGHIIKSKLDPEGYKMVPFFYDA